MPPLHVRGAHMSAARLPTSSSSCPHSGTGLVGGGANAAALPGNALPSVTSPAAASLGPCSLQQGEHGSAPGVEAELFGPSVLIKDATGSEDEEDVVDMVVGDDAGGAAWASVPFPDQGMCQPRRLPGPPIYPPLQVRRPPCPPRPPLSSRVVARRNGPGLDVGQMRTSLMPPMRIRCQSPWRPIGTLFDRGHSHQGL